jgi:hypothetical protein
MGGSNNMELLLIRNSGGKMAEKSTEKGNPLTLQRVRMQPADGFRDTWQVAIDLYG